MTDQDKKLIFDYCGWCFHQFNTVGKSEALDRCILCDSLRYKAVEHPLNVNDVLEAENIMEDRGDSELFENFSSNIYIREKKPVSRCFHVYLLQNFFPLMAEWLKEK